MRGWVFGFRISAKAIAFTKLASLFSHYFDYLYPPPLTSSILMFGFVNLIFFANWNICDISSLSMFVVLSPMVNILLNMFAH